MTPDELAGLRAVAEAATQGEWSTISGASNVWRFPEDGGTPAVVVSGNGTRGHQVKLADAEYISTFDPPTAFALLAEIERITGVARDLAVSQLERHQQRDAALAEVDRLRAGRDAHPNPPTALALVDENKRLDVLRYRLHKDYYAMQAERNALRARLAAVEALADEWIAQRARAVENRSDTPAHHWRGKDGDAIRAALAEGGA